MKPIEDHPTLSERSCFVFVGINAFDDREERRVVLCRYPIQLQSLIRRDIVQVDLTIHDSENESFSSIFSDDGVAGAEVASSGQSEIVHRVDDGHCLGESG